MDPVDLLNRFWSDLGTWPTGLMTFRFVILPFVVTVLAIRDGTRDARLSRTPYVRTILRSGHSGLVQERLASVGGIILSAVAIDLLYQSIEPRTLRVAEEMIVAILFAALPYLLIRTPAARIAAWLEHRSRLNNASQGFGHS